MATPKRRSQNDDQDLVRLYLNEAGQYPLLTKDDEARLAQRSRPASRLAPSSRRPTPPPSSRRRSARRAARRAPGDEAHLTFVQSNLRLVVSIAKRYQASGLPLLDLVQEGNLGLIHAVDKFDWRRASSSPRTRRGGSARPSRAASPTPAAPSVCRSTRATTSFASSGARRCSRSSSAARRRTPSWPWSWAHRGEGPRDGDDRRRAPLALTAPERRRRRCARRPRRRP